MVALHPGAGIRDLGEAGGVAFGEAVGAEPLDLAEGALGERPLEPVHHHAVDQLVLEVRHAAGDLEGRHRPAQLVRLVRAEAAALDRHLHRLFLEQRHAQRLPQHPAQAVLRVLDRFQPLPPTQVWMHHVALDRPRPHDRHLDHQVVQAARLQPRQHRHLRPALDLERAQRVGAADHVEGGRIVARDPRQPEMLPAMLCQQVEGAAHAAQHAEPQHVDLHEPQRVDVVLVPLDHLPVGHGGRLHRHQPVERLAAQHEAARMLAQVARKRHQLARQQQGQAQAAVLQVEPDCLRMLRADAALAPAPHLSRQRPGHVLRQPQHLADLAHRAARPEPHHGGAQRRPVAAVALEHPLDHLLAPLVLEVDVDVRRLAPAGGDEALEQQVAFHRVDRGDAEHEAYRRVGRRPSALAQDPLLPGEPHDRVHRQEVRRVVQLPDQAELVRDLRRHRLRHARRIRHRQALAHQPLQVLLVRQPRRLAFLRVPVAQLRQAEPAALHDGPRGGQRLRMIGEQPHHLPGPLEMAVHRAAAPVSGRVDRAAFAYAGDHVLQDAPVRHVVQHVAGRHRRHPGRPAQRLGAVQPRPVVRPPLQGQRAPRAVAERGAQPVELRRQAVVQRLQRPLRQQDRQQPFAQFIQIGPSQLAPALAGAPLAAAEQPAQPGIGGAIGRIYQQRRRVAQVEPCAHHQPHSQLAGTLMRPGDAGQAVAVGEAERVVAECPRLQKQLLDVARAAQERVVGGDLELDRIHGAQRTRTNPARDDGCSTSTRAKYVNLLHERLSDHAFCMIPGAAWALLDKRKRRRRRERPGCQVWRDKPHDQER